MRDVARATSAAPAYFPRAMISSIAQGPARTFVDGGMVVNNPTDLIYNRLVRTVEATPKNTWVVSLGTGTLDANSNRVHRELQRLFREGQSYWRLQPTLKEEIGLTDTRPEALDALEVAAHKLDTQLEKLARRLAENADRKHPLSF